MMKKILVSAYAVCPGMGSEQGMGWNWVTNLARRHELHVITEEEYRSRIEAAVALLPQAKNLHFHYLPVSERTRRMCWNQGDWRFYLHYDRWQRRALKLARRICAEEGPFDLIHQLNMVGFRQPGYLWKLKGIPYILGPIGGMRLTPVGFFSEAGLKERLNIRLKNALNWWQSRYSHRVRRAIARSAVTLCVAEDEYRMVSGFHHHRAEYMNETTPELALLPRRREPGSGPVIELLWVGKFMQRKQLGLALKVLDALRDEPVALKVAGTGTAAEQQRFHALETRLGLGPDRLQWLGQVSHDEVLRRMTEADIFLFTSVSEATSTVVMEAVSAQLPIVCFNTCGFGPIVDESVGIRLPLTDPEQAVGAFAEAIRKMIHTPGLLQQMSAAATAKWEALSWDAKLARMDTIYDAAVTGGKKIE